jgi:hypothetical protein
MEIHTSKGNMKIGNTMNISLPPIKTCRKKAPCAKLCYAIKAYNGYAKTTCKPNYDENLTFYKRDPEGYFQAISSEIEKNKPDFFRFHCAGDIPDLAYLGFMVKLATKFPNTKFLAFTKQYETVAAFKAKFPTNLSIVLSGWPGLPLVNPKKLPVAYMNDGTEDRIKESDIHCPGKCDSCGMCWSLKKLGLNVWFKKH